MDIRKVSAKNFQNNRSDFKETALEKSKKNFDGKQEKGISKVGKGF